MSESRFIHTLPSLQRGDRNDRTFSRRGRGGSRQLYSNTTGSQENEALSQLLRHHHSWLCELSVTPSSVFVFLTCSSPPHFRKGQRRELLWKAGKQADGECLGPGDSQGSPLVSHRNNSSSQAKARTGSGRKGSSKSLMRCAQGVHGRAQTATVLIAKSHISYEMLHGLISHTLSTTMMAFSELCMCKTRKQTFAVSE